MLSSVITLSVLSVLASTIGWKLLNHDKHLYQLVGRHDSSLGLIRLVNLIYKLISFFIIEKNRAVIDSLYVYPIKSAGKGMKVTEWEVSDAGLMYDRQYVFASFKDDKWVPLTLKDCTEFIDIDYELKDGQFIIKYAPGKSFELPMEVTKTYLDSVASADQITMRLWLEDVKSYDITKVMPADFIDHFKLPKDTKLLCTVEGKESKKGSPLNLINTIGGSKFRSTKFQDYFPFLLLSKSGLRYLNGELAKSKYDYFEVNEHSFRPNIVVDGDIPPNDEDTWFKFRVNTQNDGKAHNFTTSMKCERCSIPNINLKGDHKLDKKAPVSKTMSKYRRVDIGSKYNSFFGVYTVQHDTGYTIKKGDTIDVIQRKVSHFDSPFY